MGFFDFIKSGSMKQEELDQKIIINLLRVIFPGGDDQINTEVEELHKLYEKTHHRFTIKELLIEVSISYYLNEDRSYLKISSEFYNPISKELGFSRSSFIILYDYIQYKFRDLTFLDNKISDTEKLFVASKSAVNELRKTYDKKFSGDQGLIEVIIFFSMFVLNDYSQKYPERYSLTFKSYFEIIYEQHKIYAKYFGDHKIYSLDSFSKLVNDRFNYFAKEVEYIYTKSNYIPDTFYRLFYNFRGSTKVTDLAEITKFTVALKYTINWITNVNSMI